MKIISEAELIALGQAFATTLHPPAVIHLIGDVGVGKTTFTKGLALGLGITESITSPTFTISRIYPFKITRSQKSYSGELVHYDFYRLADPGIMQSDLDEVISHPENIAVIEWGNNLDLPQTEQQIYIRLQPDGSRLVDFLPDWSPEQK